MKWIAWVLVVQLFLANLSAAIYAYRFTHFYESPAPKTTSDNFFSRTWKLFTGPKFYRNDIEPTPSFPFNRIVLGTSGDSLEAWYSTITGARTCIILLHGYTTNKSFMEEEAAQFRSWGYNVLLADFRGHGKSGGSKTSLGVKETEDLQKAFEFAKGQGNHRIIVYGISLGAVVAIKAAAERKIDPYAIIADMPFDNLHNHFKSRAKDVGFPPEPFAFLVTMWIGIENGFNGFGHRVTSYAGKISCPVLLQWGEKDRFVDRRAIKAVFEKLGSPVKKLVTYPGGDHESLIRVDHNLWTTELSTFLKNLP